MLTSPKTSERDVCLAMLQRCQREGHLFVIGDKGYAGREFEQLAADLDATIVRPRRKDEPGHSPHLAPIRQRIESIFQTCKNLLTLEQHGARTLHGLGTRIRTLPRPRRSDQPQPPPRPTTPSPRRLHSLTPWNYSSRFLYRDEESRVRNRPYVDLIDLASAWLSSEADQAPFRNPFTSTANSVGYWKRKP